MQDIQLYSDATFFDIISNDLSLSCGACIIKTNQILPEQLSKKSIFFFKAKNPIHAEILCGTFLIKQIIDHFEFKKIHWFCDLDYLSNLINDKKISNSFINIEDSISYIKQLILEDKINIKLPKSSNEKKYHHLCHRACRMGRKIVSELENPLLNLESIYEISMSKLTETKSEWKILLV
jgi:hypothetical protein